MSRFAPAALALCGLAIGAAADAAEWSADARVRGTTEFDDNVRLSPDDRDSDVAATATPELNINRRGELLDVTINTRLDFTRFLRESNFDTNDQRVLLDSEYRTMNGSWGLVGEVNRDSTRTSEIRDTGRFEDIARKELYRVAPSRSHILSPNDVVEIGGAASAVRYNTSLLTDYNSYAVSGLWAHQLNRVDLIQTNVFGNYFETQTANETESRLVGGTVQWQHSMSERLSTSIGGGPRYVETESPRLVNGAIQRTTESSIGYLVNGGITYEIDQRTRFDGTVSRTIEPSGGGEPLERTSAEINLRWQFDQEFWFGLNSLFQFSEEPTDGTSLDRTYFGIAPSVSWNITRDWALTTTYRFRTQKQENESAAYGNSFFVSLSYQFDQWTFGH